MDFRIVIDGGQQGQPGQQTPTGSPASAPGQSAPPSHDIPGMLERAEEQRARRKEQEAQAWALDPASNRVARNLEDEAEERRRRLAVTRERYSQDTPAMEAARQYEEEVLLRRRHLDVLRERHQIEGAASEEARLQLEQTREAKEWQKKVNEERRRQDPGGAAAEDAGSLGDIGMQLTGGRGRLGMLSKLFQMAPQLQEQFAGLFGKSGAAGGGGAAAAGRGAAGAAASTGAAGAASAEGAAGAAGASAGGGFAAMAGPIGLAIAAADVIAQQQVNQIRSTTEAIKSFGAGIQQINQGDHLGALTTGIDSAAKSVESIPIVGKVFGAHIERFSELLKTANGVVESFIQRGEQLAKYSGEISASRAIADARSTLGDIREAGVMGPVIARITDSSSEIMDMLRDLLLPLKETLGEVVSVFMDFVKAIVEAIAGFEKEYGVIKTFAQMAIAFIKWARERFGIPINESEKKEKVTLDQLVNQNFGAFLPNDANQFGFRVGANPLPPGGF